MFVDDGTIHTTDEQDHINEVARCLKQLMIHDITIKMAKCIWGTDEADLIGHIVKCGEGIRPDTKKINDLLAVDYLHTIGDLKAFLGSCVFINRFIKDYAMITESLYALEARYKTKTTPIRKEGDNRNWTDLHERAFKTLKAALATAPCLAFPDWSRPFIIVADCSKYQMGGALLQLDKEGKERIIAFTSKRLAPAQVKYGVTSKEACALVHCLRKFRTYIHGNPCVAITDHKAITTVMSGREFETDRLNRLSAEVMEYDIHVCYRPGRLLTLADFMSRAHVEQDPQKRQKMADELLQWRAKQEAQAEKQEEQAAAAKIMKRIKADDMAGEAPVVGDNPPHLQSPAERSLQGDSQAFTEGKLQEHINRLVRGATVDMDDIDSCETAVQKVQQITRDMENGEYEPDSDYSSEEEETPRIIEMYDMACAALTWEPPATYVLPDDTSMKAAQLADKYTGHILKALTAYEQGQTNQKMMKHGHSATTWTFAIKDGICTRPGLEAKGNKQQTQWQTVVPKSLQPQIIQAYHSSKRNAHYGDLKTFAQLREKYTWGSAFSDVRKFVLQCEICQRFGPRPSKHNANGAYTVTYQGSTG